MNGSEDFPLVPSIPESTGDITEVGPVDLSACRVREADEIASSTIGALSHGIAAHGGEADHAKLGRIEV